MYSKGQVQAILPEYDNGLDVALGEANQLLDELGDKLDSNDSLPDTVADFLDNATSHIYRTMTSLDDFCHGFMDGLKQARMVIVGQEHSPDQNMSRDNLMITIVNARLGIKGIEKLYDAIADKAYAILAVNPGCIGIDAYNAAKLNVYRQSLKDMGIRYW